MLSKRNISLTSQEEELLFRENYLKSFSKVFFVDDDTLIIDKKYIIKKMHHFSTTIYSLANLNSTWKTDLSFYINFDHVDLEYVRDNIEYGSRFLDFTLWAQDHLVGKLSIKIGYESDAHEQSEQVAEFFDCNILDARIA